MPKVNDQYKNLSRRVLAQGETGTNSKRWSAYIENIYPSHVVSGDRCYLLDAWGNRYLDMVCGLGVNLLGYNHPKVCEAVLAQVRNGCTFSFPHPLEIEVAQLIVDKVKCIEKVRFLKTGNEATLAAIRIARAATPERYVTSSGYHGWGDLWTSLTPPALGVEGQFSVGTLDDEENYGKESIFITEPVQLDLTDSRKEQLKTEMSGRKVVIFDEIVTGFRVPSFTVAGLWGLSPDLMTLGKGIANGYPLSVVGGKKEIMDSDYFVSSTFSGDAVSLAAAKAVLEIVTHSTMTDVYFYANRVQEKANEILREIEVTLSGYGTRAMLNVEHPNTQLFMQECCKSGIIVGKAWFFGLPHLEEQIEDRLLSTFSDIKMRIQKGLVRLEGHPVVQTFKR